MTTKGFLAYLSADLTGIPDTTSTPIPFNATAWDTTGGEWALGPGGFFVWTPAISVATVVRLKMHASWTPANGPLKPGYGKLWVVKEHAATADLQLSEGAMDGPLSPANPRIEYDFPWLAQPGDVFEPYCWLATGANGHALQGHADMRTCFSGTYEA